MRVFNELYLHVISLLNLRITVLSERNQTPEGI